MPLTLAVNWSSISAKLTELQPRVHTSRRKGMQMAQADTLGCHIINSSAAHAWLVATQQPKTTPGGPAAYTAVTQPQMHRACI